jgi:hypothetical protein
MLIPRQSGFFGIELGWVPLPERLES